MGDTEERAHAELGHAIPVKNFDLETIDGLSHGEGARDEHGGGEDVAGFVGEIASEVLGLTEDVASVEAFLESGGCFGGDNLEFDEFRAFVLLRFVGIDFMVAGVDAFGDGGGEIGGGVNVIEGKDEFGGTVGLGLANRCADEAAENGGVEFVRLPGAGEDEALGLEALGTVENGGIEKAAFGFAGGFDFGEPFGIGGANGVITWSGGAAFGFELENVEGVGFDGGEGLVSKNDLHGIGLVGSGLDERGAGFGVLFFGFFGGAFVVELLAPGDGDLHLHAAALKVHFGGDDGEALFAGLSMDLGDFLTVEEELSFAVGKMVGDVAVGVFADVDIDKPGFSAFDGGEPVLELHFAGAAGFDFGPGQGKTGLKPFHELVVMAGGAVVADDLETGSGFCLNGAQRIISCTLFSTEAHCASSFLNRWTAIRSTKASF